jgi:tetratricopeptide (TPR) repeat protein
MTKEKLIALLCDPDQTGQAVDELNRLIEENPYFHTGHLLYLKGLQQTNEDKMTLQVWKTALNVRDRGVLYNYLNHPESFRRQPPPNDKPADVSTPVIPDNSFVLPDVEIHNIRNDQSEQPSSPEIHSLTGDGGWHDTEEGNILEEKDMSDDQLIDVIRRRLEQIVPQVEETAANAVTATGDAADIAAESVAEAGAVDTGFIVGENADEITQDGYSEDLMEIKPVTTDVTGTPPQDAVSQEETQGYVAAVEEKNELTSDDLIDSFLKSNPKIIPSDSKYEPNLSEGLQENPDIATETLADIYAVQGHKDKAIEIYEHLILKYPEKHIYFAAQIDRLKE